VAIRPPPPHPTHYGPTATPSELWPVKRACAPLPSRFAWLTVPPLGLTHYTWVDVTATPVPVSATVAVAAGFLPAAVKVAVTVPRLVGANRTLTVQDLPGPRLLPLQRSPVMENPAAPATITFNRPVACPPELARVKAWTPSARW
jgi:hypothetical protein